MKKIVISFLVLSFLFLCVGCSAQKTSSETTSVSASSGNSEATTNNVPNKDASSSGNQINPTDNSQIKDISSTEGDIGGADLLPRKYRNNYYTVPAFFADLIDRETFDAWLDAFLKDYENKDLDQMIMPAFVEAFHITREQFDKANLKYTYFIIEHQSAPCYEPQDFADQEMAEPYNADIIYTFDKELIDAYYLGIDYPFLNEDQYLEALQNGSYQTRTTKWVDVAEMEAEILAKYGSLD